MERRLENWLDGFLEYTENTEPPYNFKLWTAVATIAGALQRKVWLSWGAHLTWYPNFYIALVGPAGQARKGTAIDLGYDLLHALGITLAPQALASPQALIEVLREAQEIEAGEKGYKKQAAVSAFCDEFVVFLRDDREMLRALCDLYKCYEYWSYKSIMRKETVLEGVYLNILGGITPSLLRDTLPPEAEGGGLLSRIIFVYEEKGKPCAFPAPTEAQQQIGLDLQEDLATIHKLEGQFKYTSKFFDLYAEWYNHQYYHLPISDPRFAGYCSRRQLHIMKLAMICSVAMSNELVLKPVDFEKARKILEVTERKMPMALGGSGKNHLMPVIQELRDYVIKHKTVTYGELVEAFLRDATELEIRSVVTAVGMHEMFKLSSNVLEKSTKISYMGG